MAVLVASIPIPSLIGTWLNRVQTERMKRTDARVQSITECKPGTPLYVNSLLTPIYRYERPTHDQAFCLGRQSQAENVRET